MTKIPNVAEETKEKIKRSSAYSLPNNPTGAGYKPQDIKNALFKPIVDGQNSVLAEIERLINELNKVLPTIKISEMKLNGKDNTLQLLDENMQKIASIDLPFVKLTNYEETTKNIPNKIELKLNTTDYSLKAELLSPNGAISQSNEIDLPIESFVVGAEYADGMISLSLENGTTLDVELTDIVRGLVNEKDFEAFKGSVAGDVGRLDEGIKAIDEYTTNNINDLQDRVSDLEQGGTGGGDYLQEGDVQQEVNNSTNPVSSVAVQNEFQEFAEYYDDRVNALVVKQENFYNGNLLSVKHNFDYHAIEDISNLNIVIPDGNILCSIMFKTADSGTVTISIDGVKGYIGKAPDLEENGVTWELSIHNGIIASGKVVSE